MKLKRPRRVLAAGLILAAGAVHLYLWFDYFHRVHVVGTLFLVNAVSAAAIAWLLLTTRSRLAQLAGLAYSAGTLASFTLSVTVGLFGYRESLFGPWQAAAAAIEVAAAAALLGSNRRHERRVVATTSPHTRWENRR